MSDINLFAIEDGSATEIKGSAAALEKSLQTLIEANLESMLGVRFLASEYSTGMKHRGRIDTLGIDENGTPVIIEYKRAQNENVINQGLFYLDWLMDHRAEFQLLVMKTLDADAADAIEWGSPRLLCIAGDFNRYDGHAVQQMNRNIELLRYRRFGDKLLLLELVNTVSADVVPAATPDPPGASSDAAPDTKSGGTGYSTFSQKLDKISGPTADLFEELKATLIALGDDVQTKVTKTYMAFKRLRNFACVEVYPSLEVIRVYLKVDPDTVQLEEGFTRDVSNIGHYGTGDLEVTIAHRDDLHRAHDLFVRSYEAS